MTSLQVEDKSLTALPGKSIPYVLKAHSGRAHTLIDQVARATAGVEETNNAMSATTVMGPAGMPIPMHYHEHEYEFFYCFDGLMQLWTDDESRLLVAGDFGYVPPGVIHAYQFHRPGSGFVGPIIPAGWDRFLDFCGEPFDGPAYTPGPYSMPPFERFQAAEKKFEMKYTPDAKMAEPTLDAADDTLPGEQRSYFLRRGEGERYLLGGQLQTALCRSEETQDKLAMTTVELPGGAELPAHSHAQTHEHVFILDGSVSFELDGDQYLVTGGDSVNIPAGTVHSYQGVSRYSKLLSMSAPGGLEKLFAIAGEPSQAPIFPVGTPSTLDGSELNDAAAELDIEFA